MSQRKIMKAVIALERKNMHFIIKILLMKKEKETPLPEGTLSLHYVSAVLPIARVRHLRRNLKSAFARLITRARFR